MPIYEYKCEVCGEEREVEQKMSDPAPECFHQNDPSKKNPIIGSVMKKLISKSSFALKGGTWARDNYSRKK